jgi:hypothetical protein
VRIHAVFLILFLINIIKSLLNMFYFLDRERTPRPVEEGEQAAFIQFILRYQR